MSKCCTHSPEFKTTVPMERISVRETLQEIAADGAERLIQVSQWTKQALERSSEFLSWGKKSNSIEHWCNSLGGDRHCLLTTEIGPACPFLIPYTSPSAQPTPPSTKPEAHDAHHRLPDHRPHYWACFGGSLRREAPSRITTHPRALIRLILSRSATDMAAPLTKCCGVPRW